MTTFSVADWTRLDRWGLIPGPMENISQFAERVRVSLDPATRQSADRFLKNYQRTSLPHISEPAFGVHPKYVPIYRKKNTGISIYAAATWIMETGPRKILFPLIVFNRRNRWTPSDSTVLRHEWCHCGRASFEEPQFEEMLAYSAGGSTLSRILGPLFRSEGEGLAVLISCLIALVLPEVLSLTLVFFVVTFWGLRLARSHYTFRMCLRNLSMALGGKQSALDLAYRLTDREIRRLASVAPDNVLQEIRSMWNSTPRWQLIAVRLGKYLPLGGIP
jgi:hypothetical protein